MVPFRVNQQFHTRLPRKSLAIRPFRPASFISFASSTSFTSFASGFPYPLPSSVSCNSFVCHSYENCRVCTNNSHHGTLHSSQPFRSKIHPNCGVEMPTWSGHSALPTSFDLSPLFSESCALRCTFLHLRKTQPICFQSFPHSASKNTTDGGGGTHPLLFHLQLSTSFHESRDTDHDSRHWLSFTPSDKIATHPTVRQQ